MSRHIREPDFIKLSLRDIRVEIILSISVLCFFVSVTLHYTKMFENILGTNSPGREIVWELTHELGVAFLVAFLVIVFVELRARREFGEAVHERIKEIQEHVFNATFQRHIPPKIFEEVNELVFTAFFVRLRQSNHYDLKVIDIGELDPRLTGLTVVQVNCVYSSRVQNVSCTPRDFLLELHTETSPISDLENKIDRVEVDGKKVHINQKEPNRVSHKIRNVEPDACIDITAHMTNYKLLTDYEIWQSRYPTIEFEMSVQLPCSLELYGAQALHRVAEPLHWADDAQCYHTYKVCGPLLPHQGVLFWWCFDPGALGRTRTGADPKLLRRATDGDGLAEARTALEERLEEARRGDRDDD